LIILAVPKRKYTDQIRVIKNVTLHTVTHIHFCQALTLNNAKIECV